MKPSTLARKQSGFSLIEMMVTIGVLVIMTAMVMASFWNTENVSQARDQRNAQSFCTLYSAVDAAGMRLIAQGGNKLDVLRALKDGVTVQSGSFKGQTFRLPNIEESDLVAAGHFLEIKDGQMIYQSGGVP